VTTIAVKAGFMAADSWATDDCTATSVRKAVRLANGDVAGGAGDLAPVGRALAWLMGDQNGEQPDISGAQVLFTVKGVPYIADGGWPGVEVIGPVAIGSGAQGAMVAMNLGLDAEAAVRAVIGVDPATGGAVEVLRIGKQRASARK
jgi:hypothetical protein